MTTTIAPALVPADVARLDAAIARIRANTTETVLATAMPSMGVAERAALADHTYFTHAAVVVFPRTLAELGAELGTGVMTPSVVVRGRLSARYGIPVGDLDVGVLRTPVPDRAGRPCELEIFAVATPPELAHIAEDERLHNRESHFALAVPDADPIVLNGLCRSVGGRM